MDYNLRHRSKSFSSMNHKTENFVFSDCSVRNRHYSLFSEKVWFMILLFYSGIFVVVLYSDVVRFPIPVSIESLQKEKATRSYRFSEERVKNIVNELSTIGSKPTGSYENEVLAVDYINRQLHHIKSYIKPFNKIEINIQKSSGCFPLEFKDGMTSCYKDIKNIVAKISPHNATNRSLLVNCHYDSVPTSPGASDDIVNCAIMLEVLLSLTQNDRPLPHSVIFLFNGAEENILQAAHGFISQHPWASEVVGFVNLEACGAGGKQMLFQANKERTWLLQAYADGAPFPQGSVVAQDIFQSGIIPSDTDFRIFEDFGGLPGLDFAYVKNGYVYHTKYDVPQFITSGAIQQAGDNLLNLIYNALQSSAMNRPHEQLHSNLVFFDFLGFFMVVYRVSVASALNVIIVILSCADTLLKAKHAQHAGITIARRTVLVGAAVLVMLSGFIGAVMVNAIIAGILGILGCTMSWYGTPYLIAGLYGCSSLAIIISVHWLAVTRRRKRSRREDWIEEEIFYDAARLLWIIFLILMEWGKLNSSFLCSASVLFPTVIRSLGGNMLGISGTKGSKKWHLVMHLSMQIIPLLLLLYCVWSIYTVFVPIMGRIGALVNPDLLISFFTSLLVFFSTAYTLTLVQVVTTVRKIVTVLVAVVFFCFILVCCTPLGFPYSGNSDSPSPQRCYILHTERTFHNKSGSSVAVDWGYWVVPLDYNGPSTLVPYISGLKDAEPVNCDEDLICGMPFYMPVVSLLRKSYYVPASKPKIHSHRKFQLIAKNIIKPGLYRLSFRAIGPDHMTIVISPQIGINMIQWSLTKGPPYPGLSWKNRATYFIYYSYGEYTEAWEFSIELQVPKNYDTNLPLLDLAFTTHHLHGHDAITGDFSSLLNKLPQWVHATPWTSTFDLYSF